MEQHALMKMMNRNVPGLLFTKQLHCVSFPSPSLPFCGSSPGGDPTRYPRNSAKRPSASPTRFSSWAEGSPLLAGHMILRSFRADSRLFTFQMLMPPSMPVVQIKSLLE